ncbi:DUF4190 domain-containing protein [Streptomyces orinoci]|uniref:DUF4190 domain-containing protein n=1 Tax=Streptomyces orinoci TaxID=67339 RepID=A0ABV3K6Z1_STRON|nr:DUF4190 domain-containing protein [Streptomyces orinoci]
MSDQDDVQPEQRYRDPWAPPNDRVPGDEPAAAPWAGQPAGPPPQAPGHQAPHAFPAPPMGGPPPGSVPPVPPAPTGPGTPSSYQYQGDPYGGPGYPPHAPYGPAAYGQGGAWYAPAPVPNNGFGVAALVLGILGLVLSCTVVFGVVLGVLALVFGVIGRAKTTRGEAANQGQALAGLILGGVSLVASVLFVVLYVSVHHDDRHSDKVPADDPDATYGAYMAAPPAPGPLLPAARR